MPLRIPIDIWGVSYLRYYKVLETIKDFKMKLTEFMQSDFYLNYLDDLDKEMPVKIYRVSIVHDVILKIELDSLNYASLTLGDIKWLIENHRFETMRYILKKQETYTEPDGGRDNIINLAPKVNFPIGHLIEYYLLSRRPNELLQYVTKIRIPGPKKYVKEIEKIFSEIKFS